MRRYYAQLLHEPKDVMLRPSLHDLPTLDPVDDNACHLEPLPSWRDTHKLACMRSGSGHSGHDPVSLGNQLVDDMGAVGVRGRKNSARLLDPFKSGLKTRHRWWIVVD